MKTLVTGLLLLCITSIAAAQQYVIKGKISGFKNGTKFWLRDLDLAREVDSTVMNNGAFTMKGTFTDGPRSLWLYTQTKDSFYYCNLLVGNETVTIKGSSKDMPFFMQITGSKSQDVENILYRQTAPFYESRDSLTDIAIPLMRKNENPELQKSIWKQVKVLDDATDSIRRAFVMKYVNSYSGARELFYLKNKFDSATLRSLYNRIESPYKEHHHARTVNAFLLVGNPLKKGDNSKDFEAIDSSGNKHRLSEMKGKYVLLDFTETYCGPCVMAIDEMKELSGKYSEKLAIVSFNVDATRELWLKGMKRDRPEWLYLWDGKGWYSETVMKYGVTGYPSFFLLDPAGKIIYAGTGYSKDELTGIIEKNLVAAK
ncbi:MAG: TlpA disulfide reductase family protein [Chitinophagaceae bacterium]